MVVVKMVTSIKIYSFIAHCIALLYDIEMQEIYNATMPITSLMAATAANILLIQQNLASFSLLEGSY